MSSMITSRRIALPLAVVIHLLLFYLISRQGMHIVLPKLSAEPLSITIFPIRPEPQTVVKAPTLPRQQAPSVTAQKRLAKEVSAPQAVTPPPPPIKPETSVPETVPAPSPNGTLLAQSALNAIGKMDKDERGGAGRGLALPAQPGTLEAKLSAAIDNHGAYRAGVIDEHFYPDGRREERIHTPFGDYCVTYQSPSDPTDGVDTMQHGVQHSIPHTCGHRFD